MQPLDQAEAGAQRRREQAKAGRRADQREALELHRQRLRVWPIGDAHIDTKFFHRRIEKLLQCRPQPVHFIDKEDVAFLEGREHAHEIARPLQDRAGRRADVHVQLLRHQQRERGLTESRGAEEQDVIERLLALLGRIDRDLE